MKYYYNINKKNNGPVTKEELAALAEKGIIDANTPVIEVGGKAWSRWGAMEQAAQASASPSSHLRKPVLKATKLSLQVATPAPAGAPESPAGAVHGMAAKIHAIYGIIDQKLEPKSVNQPDINNIEDFKKKYSVQAAIVGIAVLICLVAEFMVLEVNKGSTFLSLIVGGIILQYICYQAYLATTPLLFGKKIKLSSMSVLRVLAVAGLCYVFKLIYQNYDVLINKNDLGMRTYLSSVLPILTNLILLSVLTYLLYHAKRFFVSIEPQCVSPGREWVNLIRLLVRAFFTALHTCAPALMILAAGMIAAGGQESLDILEIPITLPLLPIYTLFGCYLFSLLPDLLESILSIGDRKE